MKKSETRKGFSLAGLLILVAVLLMSSSMLLSAAELDEKCFLSGKVIDRNNKPVKGAVVRIECDEHDFKKVIKTDKEGFYSIAGLLPGFYSISIGKGRYWDSRHKTQKLEPGQSASIDFVPLTDAAALCGEVQDPRGQPVPSCYVSVNNVRYYKKDNSRYVQISSVTDASGFFVFDNLPPGTFEIVISKDGLVHLSPGGEVTLEKGVESEITVKIHPGNISGTVDVEGGKPEGSRNIHLVATRKDDFGGPQWNLSAGDGGGFEIKNLPPGSYQVRAYLRGFYCEPLVFKIKPKGKNKDIEVALRIAGSVLFKVTDRDGNPLDGVEIWKVIPGKGSSSVDMEKLSTGEFRVYSITPGGNRFGISSSGKGQTEKSVTIEAGKEAVVSVKV